jgi:hypothetical protein
MALVDDRLGEGPALRQADEEQETVDPHSTRGLTS